MPKPIPQALKPDRDILLSTRPEQIDDLAINPQRSAHSKIANRLAYDLVEPSPLDPPVDKNQVTNRHRVEKHKKTRVTLCIRIHALCAQRHGEGVPMPLARYHEYRVIEC